MAVKRILILEDDIKTLFYLMRVLHRLEEELIHRQISLSIMVLSEYKQVEKYLTDVEREDFDLVLLDRDCKIGGSFHTLEIEKFTPEKIVSISSVPKYNQQAMKRGVEKSVWKDYSNLATFAEEVVGLVEDVVSK